MKRFLIAGLLAALVVAPAAAKDADDFLAVFDKTCAKAPRSPQMFAAAAKAAGLSFANAISGHSEAEVEQSWRDVSYWTLDARPHGLSLSMAVAGSAANYKLSCILEAPLNANVTLAEAVARVRAAMAIGEPTSLPADANGAGASWTLAIGDSQMRIGIDIPADKAARATSIAVIMQGRKP